MPRPAATAGAVPTELAGRPAVEVAGVTKAYRGQQVLHGRNLYPDNPATYFEFIYPPLSAVLA